MAKNSTMRTSVLTRISRSTNVILNILLLLIVMVCIVPFIFVIMISITSNDSLSQFGYQFIPSELSMEAYLFLWRERAIIFRALGVSVLITIVGTVIGLYLTLSMGYVVSRKSYKLRSFYIMLLFIPMIFSGGMVAQYVVNVNIFGLKDSLWAIMLPLAVSSYNIVICRTFFTSTIPDALIESAKIDGAAQLRVFFQIVLPISKPIIATIALFLAFGYWNEWYFTSLYISDSRMYPLQGVLNTIQQNIEYIAKNPHLGVSIKEYQQSMPTESVRMAIAVVIVVPIACVYPFFQKYFITGLTLGAVKE